MRFKPYKIISIITYRFYKRVNYFSAFISVLFCSYYRVNCITTCFE